MPKRRRRSFTAEFMAQVVLEVLSGLKSQAEVARQHTLKPELIARWTEVALKRDLTLKEAALQAGAVSPEEFDRIVDPRKMVRPYVATN